MHQDTYRHGGVFGFGGISVKKPPVVESPSVEVDAGETQRGDEYGERRRRKASFRESRLEKEQLSEVVAHNFPGTMDDAELLEKVTSLRLDGYLEEADLRKAALLALSSRRSPNLWRETLELLDMSETRRHLEYGAAIATCRWGQEWERALAVLWNAKQEQIFPDRDMAINIFKAVAEGERFDLIMDILLEIHPQRKMGKENYDSLLTSAVGALVEGGHWEAALSTLYKAPRAGIDMGSQSFGIVMGACRTAGQSELVQRLLLAMSAVSMRPDQACYEAAIGACVDEDRGRRALELLKSMEADRQSPPTDLVNSVMFAMQDECTWAEALEVLGFSRRADVKFNEDSYILFLNILLDGHQWPTVNSLLEESVRRGILGIDLTEDMMAKGFTPPKPAFLGALLECTETANWSEALRLLGGMSTSYVNPGQMGLRMLEEVARLCPSKAAQRQLNKAKQKFEVALFGDEDEQIN